MLFEKNMMFSNRETLQQIFDLRNGKKISRCTVEDFVEKDGVISKNFLEKNVHRGRRKEKMRSVMLILIFVMTTNVVMSVHLPELELNPVRSHTKS